MKELTGEDLKKEKVLAQLEEAKKMDHTTLGVEFLCGVLQSDESVWSRVKDHVKTSTSTISSFAGAASYKKEQQNMLADIKGFLAKLFNDQVSAETKADVQETTTGKSQDPYFVESLNQVEESDISGDSQDDDYDGDNEDGSSRPTERKKKNRLGQRARRELWEQKYGDKAKHVRKAKDEKKKKVFRDGATIGTCREPTAKPVGKPVGKQVSDLHPSWAAKLEQKKRLQAISSSAPTRIVFDS